MSTLTTIIRSYGAAVRRMEREQQKQARESAKRFKEQQKLQEISNTNQAVLDYENYVETLISLHKNCTEHIDWNQIINTHPPAKPKNEHFYEDIAKNKLINYKPSLWDKLFGRTQKKVAQLDREIELAIKNDTGVYNILQKLYLDELQNWEELQSICVGVQSKNTTSYHHALKYFNPFSDIEELGTKIEFSFETNLIDMNLKVNHLDTIPDYELKKTTTGKLSKKNMAKSKYNELFQNHICGLAIRVAREIFAYLPLKYARVNINTQMINSETGHLEDLVILSVVFTPTTIARLNLNLIHPPHSMNNFVHNMKFSKLQGFTSVEKATYK